MIEFAVPQRRSPQLPMLISCLSGVLLSRPNSVAAIPVVHPVRSMPTCPSGARATAHTMSIGNRRPVNEERPLRHPIHDEFPCITAPPQPKCEP